MSTTINFPNKNNKSFEINLYDWSGRDGEFGNRSEEELRTVFLNLDMAMRYVHKKGYCVKSFSPLNIKLLEAQPNKIKFDTLLKLPENSYQKSLLEKEDIFNSACLQIGIYTNSIKYLKKDFLKANFDEFAKNLPQGDVPYYRGVIERGAAVYFSQYDLEKRKKDIDILESEVDSFEGGIGVNKRLVKSNGLAIAEKDMTNKEINDDIYKQINGLKDTAFINYLIIPTIIILVGFVFSVIAWVLSLK